MAGHNFRCTALALLALAPLAHSQVWIISPSSLVEQFRKSNGSIVGATATFGAPYYGARVLGQLHYAKSRGQWCKNDYQVPRPKLRGPIGEQTALISILLVQRGGQCSITTKVKVADEQGAHAVVVVDTEESRLTPADMPNIVVKDDGSGTSIRIPSILISNEDGRRLIDAAQQSTVIVELKWSVPSDHVVTADVWMSSASKEALRFLKDFSPMRKALNKVVSFQPHFSLVSLVSQDAATKTNLCEDEEGRFCTEDPDGSGPLKGSQVIWEDVRQLCIHESYKQVYDSVQDTQRKVLYAEQYWQYMEKFPDRCLGPQFGYKCSNALMREVNIDPSVVDACMNHTMHKKLQDSLENHAWSTQAVRINGWRYSGAVSADLVTRAICSAFIEQPFECKELVAKMGPFTIHIPSGEQDVSFGFAIMWMIGIGMTLFVLMLLYKRSLHNDLRLSLKDEVVLEVQAAMSQYKPLG